MCAPFANRAANRRSERSESSIELELAESSLIQDPDGTRECLKALKSIGVRLAIDEFGAGYSSLRYLRQFPLDVLKIDRSFVSDLDTNKDAQVIQRWLRRLC